MTYFTINYSSLKDFIQSNKNEYNDIDILFLLESGFINQQQYEDLMTIISVPKYDYNHFYQKDNGYYRQQGPLNNIQIINDITAEAKHMKRLINKTALYRQADNLKDKVKDIYDELHRNSSKYQSLFEEYAKCYDKLLENKASNPNNYSNDDGKMSANFDQEDIENEVFEDDLLGIYDVIEEIFPGMSESDAYELAGLALDDKGIRDIIVGEAADYYDNDFDKLVSDSLDDINEQYEDPNAGYHKSHPMDRF